MQSNTGFYGFAFEMTRRILTAEDPLQLLAGGAPRSEYDGEAERIAFGLLRWHPNHAAVRRHVTSIFNGRFWPGAVPADVCDRVATQLCQAFTALEPSVAETTSASVESALTDHS